MMPPGSMRPLEVIWSCIDRVGRRSWLAALLCALVSLAGTIAWATLVKWPEPHIHDEQSYLLAADTFRQGRLANPTHPMWRFFETFHVIHQPTYASKYQPAQGLVLAAGWAVAGFPLAGVWAAGALMAAAIWWMLRGFLPPRWALAGGLLAAAHFGTTGYWTQSYWGGCVPAAAGALLAGALPRMFRLGRARDAAAFGAGIALLANSRPYEGALLAIPGTIAYLAAVARRARIGGPAAAGRLVAPCAAIVAAAMVWMGIYNHAVTGDALRFPYAEHERQYAVAPPMLWLPLKPVPVYLHETLREFWAGINVADHARQQSFGAFAAAAWFKTKTLFWFYCGQFLAVGLLGLPCALRRRWIPFALLNAGLMLLVVVGQSHGQQPHYSSPATAWVLLLVTAGLREISHCRIRAFPAGSALVLVVLGLVLARPAAKIAVTEKFVYDWKRAQVAADLVADGSKNLVVVRYGPSHSVFAELVWNEADLEGAGVVWARDLGAEKNRELLAWFENRKAWLLEVGFPDRATRLSPYPM
jgi:hypothetical protein